MKDVLTDYDLAIIGGGPAGITAGIYATRAGLKTCIIEKEKFLGGQVFLTYSIENYPGFVNISGQKLSAIWEEQVKANKIKVIRGEVGDTDLASEIKSITIYGKKIKAEAVIIATGTSIRKLDTSNEKKFVGKSIFYSTNGAEEKCLGKNVIVFGGGNTALEDSLLLKSVAKKVYIVHRRDRFRGYEVLAKNVLSSKNIVPIWKSKISAIFGEDCLTGVEVSNIETHEKQKIDVDFIFVAIGRDANTDFIDEKVARNENGFIIGDSKMQTNIKGVFVAGDIRNTELRQIVCAGGDGAIAGTSAFKYIMEKRGNLYK